VNDDANAVQADVDAVLSALLQAKNNLKENPRKDTLTVYISFEGYNLGHGFYIAPVAVKVPKETTAAQATMQLLDDKGYTYTHKGDGLSSFYLSGVKGFAAGAVSPPDYITEKVSEQNQTGETLGEFSYSNTSGWLYSANHSIPGYGANDWILQENDVIRWQYTVQGTGADLGVQDNANPMAPLYTHNDKTSLIRALMEDGTDPAAKQAALAVVINPVATEAEIAAALKDVQDTGWIVIDNPNGRLLANVEEAIGGTDYTKVKKLRITGTIVASDIGDTPMAAGPLHGSTDGAKPILGYVEELDLSGVTKIVGSGSGLMAVPEDTFMWRPSKDLAAGSASLTTAVNPAGCTR
jgi:hypothetical protein